MEYSNLCLKSVLSYFMSEVSLVEFRVMDGYCYQMIPELSDIFLLVVYQRLGIVSCYLLLMNKQCN